MIDVSQYVAGPLATMLLADLGADVIKVEPPDGDAWRRYAPHATNQSMYFYSLNRNKRSVVLDLKSDSGRRVLRRLLATADAVVHNLPTARAAEFGLDRETVSDTNPQCVWVCVSAFGSSGPDSERPAYDLIAQAMSGLLMADVRVGDAVPRRSGGIPTADLISGLLACISVVAGLQQRGSSPTATGIEVSLLAAALTAQVQNFVRRAGEPTVAAGQAHSASHEDLDARARDLTAYEELDPYYRCYATSDGFLALACLNVTQRRQVLRLLELTDPWVDNPQGQPADEAERLTRVRTSQAVADRMRVHDTAHWVAQFADRKVPAGPVRRLEHLVDDEQVRRNGLVQTVHQPDAGDVQLLGNMFKIDGISSPSRLPAPDLGEHTEALLSELDLLDDSPAQPGVSHIAIAT